MNGAALAAAMTAQGNIADGTPVIEVLRDLDRQPAIPAAEALTVRVELPRRR